LDKIEFFVAGTPVPQGSTKAFYIKKSQRVVTTHSNKNTDAWRQRIATEAQQVSRDASFYEDDPRTGYEVCLDFIFERPRSLPKKWAFNAKRPDLDKLVRAVLDGLTGILFPDDSQVIRIVASKRYAETDEMPGMNAVITKKTSGAQVVLKNALK